MTKRRPITDRMKWQALLYRRSVLCPLCFERIEAPHLIEWDHVHELADGGAHDFTNLRPVHQACHRMKSAKATTQRGHIKRLEKKRLGTAKPKRKAKMRSRPFPKKAS